MIAPTATDEGAVDVEKLLRDRAQEITAAAEGHDTDDFMRRLYQRIEASR